MKKLITLFLLYLTSNFCQAQTPSWVKFSSPSNYANFDVKEVATAVDTLNNVYTAASVYDSVNNLNKSMLVKYNSAGIQQWKKFYDNNDPSFNGTYVVSLLVDAIGNSYVCGYGINNSNTGKDYMIIKYDSSGTKLWIQYWDGGQSIDDYPSCATFDHAGNIVIAGSSNSMGTTWDDMAAVKWSPSGNLIWSYTYNNSLANDEDRVLAVASDTNNNTFLTGSTYENSDRNMITIKLNNSGVSQWINKVAHVISGYDEKGRSIVADNAGNCYVTGDPGDWTTIKYASNGSVIWTNHYVTYALNSLDKKVMLDKFGNVIVTGDAFVGSGNFSDLAINKINSSTGVTLWSTTFNNAGIDSYKDAVLDSNSNVCVTGYFEGPMNSDMSVLIVSPNGSILWNAIYSNQLNINGADRAYNIVTDKNKNIILSGVSETRTSSSTNSVDVVTLKFIPTITGIKSILQDPTSVSIYPNPVSSNLNLSFNDRSLLGSTVKINNSIGQIVFEQITNSLTEQIDVGNLTPGIYTLTISNEKQSVCKKLIVE